MTLNEYKALIITIWIVAIQGLWLGYITYKITSTGHKKRNKKNHPFNDEGEHIRN